MPARSLIVVLLGLVSLPAWGQPQSYLMFERVGSEELGYTVNDIVVDRYGMVWVATIDGVMRYDGYGFKHIQREPGEPNSLLHNDVSALLEDRHGALWIGTDGGGLTRYDPAGGVFVHYQPDPEKPAETLSSALISVLHEDQSGIVWVGTHGGGLNRLDPATGAITHYKPDASASSLGHARVRAIHETASDTLWIGTEAGWLHRFDPQTETFRRYRVGTEQTVVRAILGDEAEGLWLAVNGQGQEAGLDVFKPQKERAHRFEPETQADLRSAKTLAFDNEGHLWIGTSKQGLYRLDRHTGRLAHYAASLDDANSLSDNDIRALHLTPAGLLWIGTNLGGLNKLNLRQKALGRYKLDAAAFGLREEEMGIYAIHQGRDGTRWLGTLAGLLRKDPATGVVTRYATDQGPPQGRLPHNTVVALHEDRAGMLWVGTYAGLVRFDPKTETATPYTAPRQSNYQRTHRMIFDIYEDDAGMLWLTSNGGGLLRFDPASERFTSYTFAEGTDDRRNYLIGIAHGEGGLWLGSMGGLLRFDPASAAWVAYGETHEDLQEIILATYRDIDGVLWLGTHDGGLIKFDPQTDALTRYTQANALPGNTVSAIESDGRGGLWITLGKDGLVHFDPRKERAVQFGLHDGTLPYFNQNAVFRTPSSLLLAGVDGYNEIGREPPASLSAPTIMLETQDGRRLEAGSYLRLARRGTALPLSVKVLDFVNPAGNRCFYRLDDLHPSWVACSQGFESFTSLGELTGEQVLRVRGVNSNGVEAEAVFNLYTPAPWWGKRWVQALGLLTLFGLGWAGVYAFQQRKLKHQYQQQAALQEARQKERDQLASWVHDQPLADLVGLRFDLEEIDDEQLSPQGEKSIQHVKDTLSDVRSALRNVCGELQLPNFKYGLSTAIRSHLNRFEKMHLGHDITLDLMQDRQRLSESVCQELFLIYRTAMNNVAKHAGATQIAIRLYRQDEYVVLEIEDNGRGFNPPKYLMNLRETQQYGLLLAERHAQTIGGRLSINSQPGSGTCIRVEVKI